MSAPRHARLTDLPGWPCVARIGDLAGKPDKWGTISLAVKAIPDEVTGPIVFDELSKLWVRGDAVARCELPSATRSMAVVLYGTPDGIGMVLPHTSYRHLASASATDLRQPPGRWIPISEVTGTRPEWIQPPGEEPRL